MNAPINLGAMQPSGPPQPQGLVIKGPIIFGLFVVVAFFGSFGVWAALAPLESAAIAPGIVNVGSKRKTIQHLEGGIVKEIQVQEGDLVEAGDVLITMDTTRAFADFEITRNRIIGEYARESRLLAERDALTDIVWDESLLKYSESNFIEKMKNSQMREFTARKRSIEGQIAILNQRMEQFRAEQSGIRSQISSQREQVALLTDELESMQRLFDKGFTGKARLLELQRNVVEVKGSLSQNNAAISRIDQNITEAELQITDLEVSRLNEVLESLRETQTGIQELDERIAALNDVLNRTNIVAPIKGVVVGLQVFTRGGVIGPGEPLMDIVPSDGELVIEARVDPVDIDVVYPGMEARVRFVSFNQRNTRPSDAKVLTISADHLTDERTGASYFLARVVLTEDALELLDQTISPGMPAEIMIVTGKKTPFGYFMTPLARSFERAFRES